MMKSLSCKLISALATILADNIRTGRFYHGLANTKLALGMEQESFDYLEKAREYASDTILGMLHLLNLYRHYRKTLGRGHHRSADVAVALGRHFSRFGDDKTAVYVFCLLV
jgi:hypothetical protein